MAVTTASDLHVLKQLGPAAIDIAFTSTPLLAMPGLVTDVSGRIRDAGGATITFPYWNSSVEAQTTVQNSRTGVTPSKLSLASADETAEAKVISVDGDEYALGDASEDYLAHLALLSGKEFGRVVQASCFRKGLDPVNGTGVAYDITAESTKTLTVDAILDASVEWGDKRSEMGGVVLLMHSKQFADIAKTNDYKTLASKAGASVVTAAPNVADMIVGNVHGIPLALCDALPSQAGLEVESITRSGSTATLTTTAAHGLQTGEKITITGATETEYNVTNAAITVTGDDTLTFAVSGTPDTPATGSPVITARYTAALVAQGAFARYVHNAPITKQIDHAGSSVITLDSHFRFATNLMRHSPRRLVRFVTH